MARATELFQVLAARDRRRILILLLDAESIEEEEAIDTRGQSRDVTIESPPLQTASKTESSTTSRATLDLHHVHLPKLEDHGFIEWDKESGTISRGPQYPAIREVLEVLSSNARAFPPDLI